MTKTKKITSLKEYLDFLYDFQKKYPENARFIFRGLSDSDYKLESAAERRLKANSTNNNSISDELFIHYHENELIEPARRFGHDRVSRIGKPLNDLELLAELQHLGAATGLMDFSESIAIATYFACQTSTDKKRQKNCDGKIIIVNVNLPLTFQKVANTDSEKFSIYEILKFNTRDTEKKEFQKGKKVWYWEPPPLDEAMRRIQGQHSVFLFAPPSHTQRIQPEEIIIAGSCKEDILKYLRLSHNIWQSTVFPDKSGFAHTHTHNSKLHYLDDASLIQSGFDWFNQGRYEKAITCFDLVIESNRSNASTSLAYGIKGLALLELKRYQGARDAFEQVIQLNPQAAPAWFYLGKAKIWMRKYHEAYSDIEHAIQLASEIRDEKQRQVAQNTMRSDLHSLKEHFQRGEHRKQDGTAELLENINHLLERLPE